MLKAEQIPDEVFEAFQKSWAVTSTLSTKECLAAAINAWPGMFSAIRTEEGGVEWDNEGNAPECLVLPCLRRRARKPTGANRRARRRGDD